MTIYCVCLSAEQRSTGKGLMMMEVREAQGSNTAWTRTLIRDLYSILLKNQKSVLQRKLLTGFEQCSQCVQSYPVGLETRQMGYMACLKEVKEMQPVDVTGLL